MMGFIMQEVKGINVAFTIALIAYLVNSLLFPHILTKFSIGTSTIALIFGSISAFFISDIANGGKWMISKIMPVTIIFLGFGLNLTSFFDPKIGLIGLFAIISTAISSFGICYIIGKYMNIDLATCIALGTGGAICGNSAVIAVSPGLKLKEDNVGVILAIINILGLITFLIIPVLSSFLGLTEQQAGIWAGSTIHAVPQAIAAGEAIGGEAITITTAIKLSRVSLLIILVPICFIIGNKISEGEQSPAKIGSIPYFIPGFIISSLLSTFFLPFGISEFLSTIGKYLLLPLLASVGFFITRESMRKAGGPLLFIGIIATSIMLFSSYIVIILLS